MTAPNRPQTQPLFFVGRAMSQPACLTLTAFESVPRRDLLKGSIRAAPAP